MDSLKKIINLVTDKRYGLVKTRELLAHSKTFNEIKKYMHTINETVTIMNILPKEEGKNSEYEALQEQYEEAKEKYETFKAELEGLDGSKFARFSDLVLSEASSQIKLVMEEKPEVIITSVNTDESITADELIDAYFNIIKDIESVNTLEYLSEPKAISKLKTYSGKRMIPYLTKKVHSKLEKSTREYLDPSNIKDILLSETELSSNVIDKFIRNFFIFIMTSKLDKEDVFYRVSETISLIVKLPELDSTELRTMVTESINNYVLKIEPSKVVDVNAFEGSVRTLK